MPMPMSIPIPIAIAIAIVVAVVVPMVAVVEEGTLGGTAAAALMGVGGKTLRGRESVKKKKKNGHLMAMANWPRTNDLTR